MWVFTYLSPLLSQWSYGHELCRSVRLKLFRFTAHPTFLRASNNSTGYGHMSLPHSFFFRILIPDISCLLLLRFAVSYIDWPVETVSCMHVCVISEKHTEYQCCSTGKYWRALSNRIQLLQGQQIHIAVN